MASDRDRLNPPRERPEMAHSSSSLASGLAFLPNLFGRRSASKAPSSAAEIAARKASASSSVTRESFEENPKLLFASPPAQVSPLPPLVPLPPPSAAPFNLQNALALMEPGAAKSVNELIDDVKATSAWLAENLYDTSGEVTRTPTLEELGLAPADVRSLYSHAMEFGQPTAEYALRTAAVRLLALLVGFAPPRETVLDPDPAGLPLTITRRAIYRLVATWSGGKPGSAYNEQMFVEVGALKALTRNGEIVEGLDGIVGWLLKLLAALKTDWLEWCASGERSPHMELARETQYGPIVTPTPAVTAADLIDLVGAIIRHRIALFSPSDLTQVVRPIVEFLRQGIVASVIPTQAEHNPDASTAHGSINRQGSAHNSLIRHSQSTSNTNSPSMTASRRLESRRGSVIPVGRVEPFPSAAASPALAPANSPSGRTAKQVPWAAPFKSLCQLVHTLFETTTIEDALFEEVFELLCFAFGQDDRDALMESADESFRPHELLRTMLGTKSGRRGELALRKALEGKLETTNTAARKRIEVERKVTRGAVIIARQCCDDPEFQASASSLGFSFPSLASSLVAAESTTRFPGRSRVPEWELVDAEIMSLLDNHLSSVEFANIAQVEDAWTQAEAACQVLDGLLPLVRSASAKVPRTLFRSSDSQLVTSFGSILLRIPNAIGRLNAKLHTSSSASSPTTSPASNPSFFHPKYIELLLDLHEYLDEETAALVIDNYQRECLCLPFTSGWLKNIWRLLESFCQTPDLPVARMRVLQLLFKDVYGYVEDLPESRHQLVEQVIVPFLAQALPEETDDGLLTDALEVLISAAAAETLQKEEERRAEREETSPEEQETEDSAPEPTEVDIKAAGGGCFNAIRAILIKLASESRCKNIAGTPALGSYVSIHSATAASNNLYAQLLPPPPGASTTAASGADSSAGPGRDSREGRPREQSSLRTLMRTLSPGRDTETPTHGATNMLTPPEEYFTAHASATSPGPGKESNFQHFNCKSLHAIKALLAIFSRIAFPSLHSFSGSRPARSPASARAILVYRDLLNLLFAMVETNANPTTASLAKIPASCPRARLTILQFAMRLRADRGHRILFRDNINRFVSPFAANLFRTTETANQMKQQLEQDDSRRRARALTRSDAVRPGDEERGRSSRIGDSQSTTRSRSRSKAPQAPLLRATSGTAIASDGYNPLWCLPEMLSFEAPPDNHPSDILSTYDPLNPSELLRDGPRVVAMWLPVSEYVRVLNGILRWDKDWELVSYVLCFLPQQLGNKHFFHGRTATNEIKALLQVLCDIVSSGDHRRFQAPSFIKRTHINSAAYQAISILISYRSVLYPDERDRLVTSFVDGLEGHGMLAKPCLQALTVCIYEMDDLVAKHMVTILRKLQQIVSMPATSIHILEFLIALANSNVYRNFTEDNYRLVFAISIGYIAEHNARSAAPVPDIAAPGAREQLTLSQHVIGLAYQAIYQWFLVLSVRERHKYVPELIRGLLHAKSQRMPVDERTEVCFDWLARYSYGNADPKPATSFLNEVVMSGSDDPPKSQSWLLGNAVLTVTSHQRTGWATITATRTTGQTNVLCKLENIPLIDLGENNAELQSLPAVLMANRERPHDANDQDPEMANGEPRELTSPPGPSDDKEAMTIVKMQSPPEAATTAAELDLPAGPIWAGTAPSQRRKDVMIEPSYLALQLLSSYPNETRGAQLIPKEPKFDRALRGLENTPVINTYKIAVLYVAPGQRTENEILGNTDGSPLYLDFLSGLGRIIKLKGQIDVFTGGMDRENDTDGQYAYAWWDDLGQMIFHAPTLMPNVPHFPDFTNKKRLVGNDYVKIVYNESGYDFAFDTIKTAFNFVNIIVSPYATRDVADAGSLLRADPTTAAGSGASPAAAAGNEWGGDSEDYFKIILQRAPGIPEFSPIGEYKLVSRRNLPVLVRQIALYATAIATRFQHVRDAPDPASAEFITIWRARFRAIKRLQGMLPSGGVEKEVSEEAARDFTRVFSINEIATATT